jgi:hypothetical protein
VKTIDPGHEYQLAILDAATPLKRLWGFRLRFVKRVGEKYPGNTAPGGSGPTSQEVIRALIARTQYFDAQAPHGSNTLAIASLRDALVAFEVRAAWMRGDGFAANRIRALDAPELEPTCERCGHLFCSVEHGK